MLKTIRFEILIIGILLINIFFLTNFEIIFYNNYLYFQQTLHHVALKKFFENITLLGESAWYFGIPIFILIICYFIKKSNLFSAYYKTVEKLQYVNILLFLSVFISGALTQLIKHIVGRPRPSHLNTGDTSFYLNFEDFDLNFFTFNSEFHSFPSGHTSTIFAFVLVISLIVPKLKYFFYLLAIIIAYSRIALGAHFITDVFGGIAIAFIGFKLSKLILSKVFLEKNTRESVLVIKNNFILVLIVLLLFSIFLFTGPTFDIIFNNFFFLGKISGYGHLFLLQSNDFVTIFFRKIILFSVVVYIFFLPALSLLIPINKIFFNYTFKLKDVFFIWISTILNLVVVVNLILKNMWGRARPNDIIEFGGKDFFTPWYQISSQCNTNCSFVSGDAAVGFALIIFYFLTKKEIYIWFALFFGFIFGFIRIMEGGHFFSDITLSCFVVFLFSFLFYSYYTRRIKGGANFYLLVPCVLFIILKLISIAATDFSLYGDEAQYWLWSKELAFGYYSKPPLLAWIIRIFTSVLGNSFFLLKTIPIILYCITSSLVFILTKNLYNNNSLAFCCALTFFLLPAVSLSSFLLSTDIVLILLWTATLTQILRIKKLPTLLNFLVLGLLLGLSFLAKYAALYFLAGLILLFIIEKNYREFFLKFKFKLLVSLLVATLVVSPNILWNYQNNWLTLEHTADNISLNNVSLNLIGLVEFLFSQIIMIGPVLFIGFLLSSYKKINIGTNEKFLICFALPAIIIVSFEGLLVRAHANWAAVSLVSLSIFLACIVYKYSKRILYLNNYLNLIIGMILFIMIGTNFPFTPFDRINGLKEFVQILDEKKQRHITNIIVSDRLLFASLNFEFFSKQKTTRQKINFFTPVKPGSKITNHFQLNNPLPSNFSRNFILIGNKKDIGYLKNIQYLRDSKKIKFLGSGSFPFVKERLMIYEVLFDEIVFY